MKSIIELEEKINKMRIAHVLEWCIENNIPNYWEMDEQDLMSIYVCLEIKEKAKNEIKRTKEN